MSLNDARINIFTYFKENWSATPIVFEGETAGDSYVKRNDPWIYAYISWGAEHQKSTGGSNSYIATTGIFAVKMYIKKANGVAIKDQYTDQLLSLFRQKTFNNISFDKPKTIGSDDDWKNDWTVRYFSIPFVIRSVESLL